ncbi:unnamed protein product [Prunus armeniaca]
MKHFADKHRTEREFQQGAWVLSRVGSVAYKLQLPGNSKIHNVFHVSLLKKKVGVHVTSSPTLPPMTAGVVAWVPAKVLNRGIFKRQNKPVTRWLIQREGLPEEDATWEDASVIQQRFPSFQP